jgi:hypothetical protein
MSGTAFAFHARNSGNNFLPYPWILCHYPVLLSVNNRK